MQSSSFSLSSPQERALWQQLGAAVEPLTRFDDTALESLGATTETVLLTACQRFLVSFEIDQETDTGGLPAYIPDFGDAPTLTRHLQVARRDAYASLPERLERWQSGYAQNPEARFTPPEGLADEALGGYEIGCLSCSQTGQVRCDVCEGQQQIRCDACNATGKQPCGSCDGHGNLTCRWCGGPGYLAEARTRTYTTGTHGDQVEHTETYYVTVPCTNCHAHGTLPCPDCVAGEVPCRQCQGRRSLPCTNCQATGAVVCAPCAGTGWRHETGRLRCEVTDIFFVEAKTDRQEVRACLEDMETLRQLCAMASMQLHQVTHHQALFERVYTGTVPVTTLSLRAAGLSLEIVGYGDPPRIYDYKNLIGHLLQADLHSLETALAKATRPPSGPRARVEEALSRFLASPANVHLGEQALASSSAVPNAFMDTVVSSDYAHRAKTALRAGIEQVYKRTTPLLLAGLLLLPLPLLFLADATGFWPLGWYSPVLTALGAGLVASLLEFLTLRRLRQLLGPALGTSAQNALRQTGALQQRRRWLAAMTVCGALAGWFGTAMIEAFLWTRRP